jgi:uncharacterized repeat protein (TIGR01451 family)
MKTLKPSVGLILIVAALAAQSGVAAAAPPPRSDPKADLWGTISIAQEAALIGENVTITVEVTNAGPDSVRQVWVELQPGSTMSFVSASSTVGTCKAVEPAPRCSLGTLRPQTGATITWTATGTEEGWAGASFFLASDEYANEPDYQNNWGSRYLYIYEDGPKTIEVGCSATLGEARGASYWDWNPFGCVREGYISTAGPATLELLPGATFTGTLTVYLYRYSTETDPGFSRSFTRQYVAGVPTSDVANAETVELTPGIYHLRVGSSSTLVDTNRRVCTPLRPTCVGNEDYYNTYRSTSHGSYGARVSSP